MNESPIFCHPADLTIIKMGHTEVRYQCLQCGGPATFSLNYATVAGKCWACGRKMRLHQKYWGKSPRALFTDPLGSPALSQRSFLPSHPAPAVSNLSPNGREYLNGRGLSDATLDRYLHWIKTTFKGDFEKVAFVTTTGYQLRAIRPDDHYPHLTLGAKAGGITEIIDPGADTVWVFESFIDLLSYAELHDPVPRSLVVLHSITNEYWINPTRYPDQNIVLALDNDGPGLQASSQIQARFANTASTVTLAPPHPAFKDWNGYLSWKRFGTGLPADYLYHCWQSKDHIVVTEPMGSGKTRILITGFCLKAHAEQKGVLIVVDRNASIREITELLVEKGIPREWIGAYYADSADFKALVAGKQEARPIGIITKKRFLTQDPAEFIFYHRYENEAVKVVKKEYLIVDETIPPLTLARIGRPFLDDMKAKILDQMSTDKVPAEVEFKGDWIDYALNKLDDYLDALAQKPLQFQGVTFTEVEDAEVSLSHIDRQTPKSNSRIKSIRKYILRCIYAAYMNGRVIEDPSSGVTILTNHLNWTAHFEKVAVLDATAPVMRHFIHPLFCLIPRLIQGDFIDKVRYYFYFDVVTEEGRKQSLGKKAMEQVKEKISDICHHQAASLAEIIDFTDNAVAFTYKQYIEEGLYTQETLNMPVGVSGGVSGDNRYREKSTVFKLGFLRPPVAFCKAVEWYFAHFQEAVSDYGVRYALSELIQSIGRTRPLDKDHIDIILLGEKRIRKAFEELTQLKGFPIAVAVGPIKHLNKLLVQAKSKIHLQLLRALADQQEILIKNFADQHTGRDTRKVIRGLASLTQQHPELGAIIRHDRARIWLDTGFERLNQLKAPAN